MTSDNIFARRNVLLGLIAKGCVDKSVLAQILPDGIPLPDEDLFWDYKESLPILGENPDSVEKEKHKIHMSQIVKDAVAFYNSYGGYLVIGVKDGDRSVCGFDGSFDANDLCKKIEGATRTSIDVKYRTIDCSTPHGSHTFGLLYIPSRPKKIPPVQFLKDAPVSLGKKAYSANDIFMRSREECRRATSSSDLAFLFNRNAVGFSAEASESSYIENNLPSKDPNLIEFVGREQQMNDLWRWFVDRYTAVKLLSGPGGVGKTSIAWTFCDSVTANPPPGLEKIIWLTAKKRTYAALLGKYVDISHTHFSDLTSLLTALLAELGVPDNQIPEEPSREELIEECITVLKEWPCLLVVDDVDSLPAEEQYDVFRTISTIFDRVIATGGTRARALLTARLNLGAAPGQLVQVTGLPLDDFKEYVLSAAEATNAHLPAGSGLNAEIKNLHEASSGSPLFAASILRLVTLGEPLSRAIRQYKGAEGEEVRKFAFEREIGDLTDSQLRLLFAAVHLGDCSIDDLVTATSGNRSTVRDDVGVLRDYHLMSLGAPTDGFVRDEPMVSIRKEISAMSDILRKSISDPNAIETKCAKINRESSKTDGATGLLFSRVLSYWREKDFALALEAAEHASKKAPNNPDVWCLLGRAYLLIQKPNARKADAVLRKAAEMGSQRSELLPLRIEAKQLLNDWVGIVHLLDNKVKRTADQTLLLATALQVIGNDQARGGSQPDAEATFLKGVSLIREAFQNGRAKGVVEALRSIQFDLAISYVGAVSRRCARDDDKIAIWVAAVKMHHMGIYNKGITSQGIAAAGAWSTSAERRPKADLSTLHKMEELYHSLKMLAANLETQGSNWAVVADLADYNVNIIGNKLAALGRRLSVDVAG
jgi:tetratricopeptide (TPR) repeat protein